MKRFDEVQRAIRRNYAAPADMRTQASPLEWVKLSPYTLQSIPPGFTIGKLPDPMNEGQFIYEVFKGNQLLMTRLPKASMCKDVAEQHR